MLICILTPSVVLLLFRKVPACLCYPDLSVGELPFSHSLRVSVSMTHALCVPSSENFFILPLVLKDSITRYRIQGSRFLLKEFHATFSGLHSFG